MNNDSFANSGLPGDSSIVLLPSIGQSGGVFTIESYAGITGTVQDTEPVCVDQKLAKGSAVGSIASTFNPGGAAYDFDFGNGNVGVNATHFGPVSTSAVTASLNPQVTIIGLSRKATVSTVGLYIAYQ